MKIKITTIREFPSNRYKEWAAAQRILLHWLDTNKLLHSYGPQTFSSAEMIGINEVTKATTTVEIIER